MLEIIPFQDRNYPLSRQKYWTFCLERGNGFYGGHKMFDFPQKFKHELIQYRCQKKTNYIISLFAQDHYSTSYLIFHLFGHMINAWHIASVIKM